MKPSRYPERDAEIGRLLRSREHSLQSIGDIFGLCRESIRRIATRDGIADRHGRALQKRCNLLRLETKFPKPAIIAEYLDGATLERVAAKFGTTKDIVKRILLGAGITLRKYSARDFCQNTKRVIELSREGIGPSEIAEQLGITLNLVSNIRRRRNLTSRANDLRRRTRDECYPYLTRESDDPTGLLAVVNRAVPPSVPHFIRADVCQDILVMILEGKISADGIAAAAPRALANVRKMHPFLFAPVSLDQEIPGTDGLRMIDTIASDRLHF